jgi:lipopolysaccharide transport protein LptA
MAISFPDLHRRVAVLGMSLFWLVSAQPAQAPQAPKVAPKIDTDTPVDIDGKNARGNLATGTFRLDDVTMRQGPATTVRAATAAARKGSDNNSTWDLTGGVHIEFSNVVLEADSATVVFGNRQISTVSVQGKPARFSHQQKDGRKSEGRAATIDYDARSGNLRLAGGSWLFDGRNEVETNVLLYNLNEGTFSNDRKSEDSGRTHIVIRPANTPTVPTPRTPERATAQ